MFALIYKPVRRIFPCTQIIKTHYLGFLGISRTIAISSSTSIEKDNICPHHNQFTVSYLINKIGLSPQVAISKSRRVKFESSDVPDSVLASLRDHGFDNTHISKIITRIPALLVRNPNDIILPKLKFFASVGISNDVLVSNPYLLERRLDDKLIPCYEYFKSLLVSEKQMGTIWRRLPWDFVTNLHHTVGPNVNFLKQIGVPCENIVKLVIRTPGVMSQHSDKFKKLVDEVVELKFDPSCVHFVSALSTKFGMSIATWEHKIEVYKRWGWSEEEVLLAFRRHSLCMTISEKKIMNLMDFLVNKMGFESIAVAKRPVVLSLSLESRIIPRCSVIRVLRAKGLKGRDLNLSAFRFLILNDNQFVDKFITKYQEQLPQLLAVYQGKLENQIFLVSNLIKYCNNPNSESPSGKGL